MDDVVKELSRVGLCGPCDGRARVVSGWRSPYLGLGIDMTGQGRDGKQQSWNGPMVALERRRAVEKSVDNSDDAAAL